MNGCPLRHQRNVAKRVAGPITSDAQLKAFFGTFGAKRGLRTSGTSEQPARFKPASGNFRLAVAKRADLYQGELGLQVAQYMVVLDQSGHCTLC